MLKIGISTCDDKSLSIDELLLMKKSGIDSIEISYENYDNFDFLSAKANCDTAGIEIWSMHLPFVPFEKINPASPDEVVRENTFVYFCELIKKGADIGIDKFVVHPSGEPNPDDEREERLENSAMILSRLADFAADFGAVILVEDLPRTCIGNCSDEMLYILNKNDKLRACFDTNHLLGENISDFIKKVGNKIASVHISDYDFVNERHWLCGVGDIDWQELYKSLLEAGYNGVWMYEISLEPPKTIDCRVLEYKDFYNNALEIFNGNVPTPIGKRKENLGFWG